MLGSRLFNRFDIPRYDPKGHVKMIHGRDSQISGGEIHSITNRDWLAAMAMQGLLANAECVKPADLRRSVNVIAERAYEVADAMLTLSKAQSE